MVEGPQFGRHVMELHSNTQGEVAPVHCCEQVGRGPVHGLLGGTFSHHGPASDGAAASWLASCGEASSAVPLSSGAASGS